MNNRNENQITMFKAVFALCQANLAIIIANAGLNNIYVQFSALLTNMLPTLQAQILNRKGVTINKKDTRAKLVAAIEEAGGIIMSHFDSNHNNDIFVQANVSLSKLKTMRDMKLIVHANTIRDLLEEHQVALLPFGVDAAYIAAYDLLLDDYDSIVTAPTAASNARKTATLQLTAKVKEVSNFLRKDLDKAMLVIKRSEPDFYITYLNARNIIDLGIRHLPADTGIIKGTIKDEATGLIIPNAVVQVINTPTIVIADELGTFMVFGLPAETYSIKISAGGYENKIVENIVVVVGDTISLDIVLTPA